MESYVRMEPIILIRGYKNGNVGTLLYVHGNPGGEYQAGPDCMTIADLTEEFIKGQITFDDALQLVRDKKITYAPDATMQALLSDIHGRVLIIEPGLGYREEHKKYSLITNYSLIDPESTKKYIVPGDDRYERALQLLTAAEMISRYPTHILCFMPSVRRVHGLPEYPLFTLQKNRRCIMWRITVLNTLQSMYFLERIKNGTL